MDQYDKAQIRAKKFQDKRIRYKPLHDGSLSRLEYEDEAKDAVVIVPTIHKPKTPVKRTNEIAMTVYVDGQEIELTARLNLNDIIGSARNKAGLAVLIGAALQTKFGKVDIA